MTTPEPWRRFLAEFVGTALLVTAVVGSGIMASRLSPHDVGLQLLECSTTVALALGALILMLGPVSGAHFNPVVSVADWFLGRRTHAGPTRADLTGYVVAQVAGAVAGSVLANLMFGLSAVHVSIKERSAGNLWVGEVVATAGLILLVFALVRAGRAAAMPAAVGAYIGAACWFTSSASFANPAVTIGRAFTDTSTGIAAASVPGFIGAQFIGLALGVALLRALYPAAGRTVDEVPVDAVRERRDRTDRPGKGQTHRPVERSPTPVESRPRIHAPSRSQLHLRLSSGRDLDDTRSGTSRLTRRESRADSQRVSLGFSCPGPPDAAAKPCLGWGATADEAGLDARAVNAAGPSVASTGSTATPNAVPPAAPTGLWADSRKASAQITFTPGDDRGSTITSYRYTIDGGTTWTTIATTAKPDGTRTGLVTDLTNGTAATIAVRSGVTACPCGCEQQRVRSGRRAR